MGLCSGFREQYYEFPLAGCNNACYHHKNMLMFLRKKNTILTASCRLLVLKMD